MTAATIDAPSGLELRPAYQYRPPHASTNGDIAAGVGADLGWDLDRDQRWLLDGIFAEDDDELPASGDVAVIGPRQTVGKTATLEVAAITDVVVFDVPLHVWTAHEFATARKSYLDMRARLLAHPDYRDRVSFRDAHGEEAIFFEMAGAIEFRARSGGSGRGFTTNRITLDEALFLRPGDLGALVPTGVTMPDFQVRYGSSAGLLRSAMLREIRNRGRNPGPDEDICYLEMAAPRQPCDDEQCAHAIGTPGCALDDRALWWAGNSGLWWGRVTEASVARQRRILAGAPGEFAREFLSWWEDPGAADAFGAGKWEACAGSPPPADLPVGGLALAVSYDLTRATVGAAAVDGDDVAHLVPLVHGPGTGWVVERAKAAQDRYGPEVVVDGGGPAADLIPKLQQAGVRLRIVGTGEVLDACAGIWKRVQGRRARHALYPELERAAGAAVQRLVGDRWAWGRKQSEDDISAVEAVTLAAWLAEQPAPEPWAFYDD